MTQIINIITFLKELFFPSDRNTHKKGANGLKSLFFMVTLLASLGLNYYTVRGVYTATYQTIALKEELKELRPLVEKAKDLQRTNEILTMTLTAMTLTAMAPAQRQPPGRSPVKGKPSLIQPPAGPRHVVSKEPVIEGKTIAGGN